MEKRLLEKKIIIDVGNTNIKVGVFNNHKIDEKYSFSNQEGEFINILNIIKNHNADNVFVGSVVPKITESLNRFLNNQKIKTNLITNQMFSKHFDLKEYNLDEVGSDILAFSLYLKQNYNKAIGICFGTATFSTCVDNNVIHGVSIITGVEATIKALIDNAALIDGFAAAKPCYSFGKNTTDAITSGLFHSTNGLINDLASKAYELYQIDTVVITGGNIKKFQFEFKVDEKIKLLQVDEAVLEGYFLVTL